MKIKVLELANDYINHKSKYPKAARSIKGTVYVQFKVNIAGKITDIKAVKRLSPEYDVEAVRESAPLKKNG